MYPRQMYHRTRCKQCALHLIQGEWTHLEPLAERDWENSRLNPRVLTHKCLWWCLQQWKESNWQPRGKPIWAAAWWQDIATQVENLVVEVRHVDAHMPKNWATKEH